MFNTCSNKLYYTLKEQKINITHKQIHDVIKNCDICAKRNITVKPVHYEPCVLWTPVYYERF